MNAINELQHLTQKPGEYKAKPVKRAFIPKPGKAEKRPLGIPTLTDRAMQAVYLYSIDPLVEETSDANSYGFRPYPGAREATAKIRDLLGKDYSPNWLLDADIEKCFDRINHNWLLEHVPIVDREVLQTWLQAGVETGTGIELNGLGVPQGGVISPTLSNIALNGLEKCAQEEHIWCHDVRERKCISFATLTTLSLQERVEKFLIQLDPELKHSWNLEA